MKQWMNVDVPEPIKESAIVIITVLVAHFTVDSPPAAVAREAVTEASDKADLQTAKDKTQKESIR
jgi:hypothetical protein